MVPGTLELVWPLLAILAGSSRLGMPCCYCLVGASKCFTGLFKRRALCGEDHSKALLSGVLCRAESNPSLHGLWLLLAFLSKVPLMRPQIIGEPGHCQEAAVAEK